MSGKLEIVSGKVEKITKVENYRWESGKDNWSGNLGIDLKFWIFFVVLWLPERIGEGGGIKSLLVMDNIRFRGTVGYFKV